MTPDAPPTTTGGPYWEPWVPEIGQRVRVRLSPECPEIHGPIPHGATGRIGIVDGIPWTDDKPSPGHRHLVWLDTPIRHPDGFVQTGLMASAMELEPLDPEPRP